LPELERTLWAALGAAGVQTGRGRPLARTVAALIVSVAVLLITALNEQAPLDIRVGLAARVVAGLVPLLAAALAGAAVLRPRPAYLAILLLIPVVDVAQVSWVVGPLQVIDQTIFVVALGVGLLLRDTEPRPSGGSTPAVAEMPDAGWRSRISLLSVAAGAMLLFLLLAGISTAVSPDRGASSAVLLHGILEPAAIAVMLLALRPDRRFVVATLIVLGASVGIGGAIDIVQQLGTFHSLSVLQAQRGMLARLNYFNVGLFGEVLAMAGPLLVWALIDRRRLQLNRTVVVLLALASLAALASLFLTFSKSGYLATAGGLIVLLLLIARSWRRRATIIVAAGFVSTVLIPWPALFLQVAPPLENAYRTVVVAFVGQTRYDSWNPSTLAGKGSVVERFYATRAAVEMAVDHPLLGIGLDQFLTQYLGHYKPPQATQDLDSAHTMWPEIAAELGFPALALVLIVYAAALLATWRVYRSPPDELMRLLAAALLAAQAAWLAVATAYAGDMYRFWRNMASDYVMMMVLVAAAFALYRVARGATADATANATDG
jgi:O-antigen ligase